MEPESQPVALITGCSSGFGLLTAKELKAAGFVVFPTMRDVSKRRDLDGFEVLQLDVTKPDSVRLAVETVIEKTGRLDVLVNNAGIGIGGFFEDLMDDEIRSQFETNVFGLMEVTRKVLPIMRKQKRGRIINISSISGLVGAPVISAYVASKHAVEGFSESLSLEVAGFGIEVVLIEPGMYRTEIFGSNRRIGRNARRPDSPYFHLMPIVEAKVNQRVEQASANPAQVARVIRKAATIRRPAARYLVGIDARIQAVLKGMLPRRWMNVLVRKALGLP